MTASVALACGGRRGSARLITIHCDAAGCSAMVVYTNREEYLAAGNAGWRRDRVDQAAEAKHRCPEHAHQFGVLAVASA